MTAFVGRTRRRARIKDAPSLVSTGTAKQQPWLQQRDEPVVRKQPPDDSQERPRWRGEPAPARGRHYTTPTHTARGL